MICRWYAVIVTAFKFLYGPPLRQLLQPYSITPTHARLLDLWKHTPAVLCYAPQLCPRNVDYPEDSVAIGGAIMDEHTQASLDAFLQTEDGAKLVAFLDGGSSENGNNAHKPTVCVTFGSMWQLESPESKYRLLRTIIAAARELKPLIRGVVVQCDEESRANFNHTDLASANVLAIGKAPHSWLFPQVDVVVCHGGAGTVHKVRGSATSPFLCSITVPASPYFGATVP